MSKYWLFENVNLLEIICPHKFKEYSKNHVIKKYDNGQFIYEEGDVSKNFYLIKSGKIKIGFWNESEDEIVMAYLKKGDIFGENIIINEKKRNEFAQSVEKNTEICVIDLKTVNELMQENNNFSIGIYKFIGFKFRKIERKYQIMLFRNTKTRLIEFLKEMIDDCEIKKSTTNDVFLPNPYSQSEMAKLIGTSRSTFNQLLKELEKENYIVWKRGSIILKNKLLLDI
jgi:CRP/FNR family cyclic AMP-dependent transcriptional regulator